jgi:dienelactone hydrolase
VLQAGISKSLRAIATAFFLLFSGSGAVAAPLDEAQKTEFKIPAGDVVLAATLYRPRGAKGDLPAVVLGHGSGPVTRERNGFWVRTALKTGMAVLVFDKRGSGESTGQLPQWKLPETPAMFQTLASDIAYAARLLAKQPGIDRNRIGLMGGSQAGWILPLAASQEPLVKFVIIGEGVPLPPGLEEMHGNYLRAVSREGEENPTLRQVSAADMFAMDYVGQMGFDPAPVLEKLTTPVLWTVGLYDGVIPARQSIDRIGQLHKAGKTNHSLHIFPFGDHNFNDVFTGNPYDMAEVSRGWLKEIMILP